VAGIGAFVTVLLMAGAYVPTGVINPPPNLETPRQFVLASRMVRVLALLVCLLFICIILMMCYPTAGCGIPLIVLVILIALTPVVFAIFIRRARNR
jgi:hypothetical protein